MHQMRLDQFLCDVHVYVYVHIHTPKFDNVPVPTPCRAV
jgi:hypothetical protein